MIRSILIVEDEFIVAEDIQLTLQSAGYNVCGIADNVAEAKKIISGKKPSLVLLDILLKGNQTGIELAKELKEQNIAFVYLSANSNQKTLDQAKSTEPYGFLVKPFREKDLLMMIDIAFFKHENSLETKRRNELFLEEHLYALEKSGNRWEQKLLSMANAFQQQIPFDMMAVKFKQKPPSINPFISLYRIGYDEYQVIAINELRTIAGLSEGAIKEIIYNSPIDYIPTILNKSDFFASLSKNKLRELIAQQFGFSSALNISVIIDEDNIASITLYRKQSEGFLVEHLHLLLHTMLPLIKVIKSLPVNKSFVQPSFKPHVFTQNNFKNSNIIGSSSAWLKVLGLITQVAPVDTSVLILGESGTGKEKIASSIHELSQRNNKPFIKINCSALPPTLIESELFGHEKGAFTNALEKRIGKFELANNGTIFLDEIGEMPLDLQVKLLRVLQEKEIERIGGKETIKVDVRVIAATNRNLQAEMANGKFRLDLYYRLNVFPVTLPPLRERKEDIQELAEYFATTITNKFNKPFQGISDDMLKQLMTYDFPGNIRELENIIEQSAILNDGNSPLTLRYPLTATQVLSSTPTMKTMNDIKQLHRQTEIDHISSILKKTRGRIRGKEGAAELLDEKPTTLESRMLKLGIKKEDFQ